MLANTQNDPSEREILDLHSANFGLRLHHGDREGAARPRRSFALRRCPLYRWSSLEKVARAFDNVTTMLNAVGLKWSHVAYVNSYHMPESDGYILATTAEMVRVPH